MVYQGTEKIELSSEELKWRAVKILLGYKYEKVNGVDCVDYISKPIKKDPWRKGRQLGVKNKVNR